MNKGSDNEKLIYTDNDSGNSAAHCGTGCQSQYSDSCEGTDVNASFQKAIANGKTDAVRGGQWYWDASTHLFWSWDTAELINEKIGALLWGKGLGGVMAWSLVQDSHDWSRLRAMQQGVESRKY